MREMIVWQMQKVGLTTVPRGVVTIGYVKLLVVLLMTLTGWDAQENFPLAR